MATRSHRSANARVLQPADSHRAAPQYELRIRPVGPALLAYEIWQLPAPASPQVRSPLRVAGLQGRNLELIEHQILRKLREARAEPQPQPGLGNRATAASLGEDLALQLGLLFRALAPMRSRDRMRAVAKGIERMDREEAAYWLGMAMHRRRPRRVLAALRMLLAEPSW